MIKYGYMPKRRTPLEERFWSKVALADPSVCWAWIAAKSPQGYGRIGRQGKYGGALQAHRAAWAIHYGAVPRGLFVLHSCDNRPCVNPSPVFLGTARHNARHASGKGRMNRGEQNASHKLTPNDVRSIFETPRSGAEAAQMFGVSQATVSNIRHRKVWKHVTIET